MKPNSPQTVDKTGTTSTAKPGKTARLAIFLGILTIILAGTVFVLTRPKTPSQPAVVNVITQPTSKTDTVITEPISDKPETTGVKKTTVKSKGPEIKEVFNPAKYLTSTIKTRKNVVGQAVIGGYITNISSNMVFKDIVLDVSYLSKTGAVISTQRFVVYEIIQPGKKANFKFKTRQPAGTKTYSTELITAVTVK